jgi:protein involved in polysaccharide export with SLBB domain
MSVAFVRTPFLAAAVLLVIAPCPAMAGADPAPSPSATVETVKVLVLGAVPAPGAFALPAGARLSDALEAAGLRAPGTPLRNVKVADLDDLASGCASNLADLHRVFLTRTRDGKTLPSYMIDLERSWSDSRYNVVLRDGDKIFVPQCRLFTPKVISHPNGVVSSASEQR